MTVNGMNYVVDNDCLATVNDSFLGGSIPNFTSNFAGIYDSSSFYNQLVCFTRILTMSAGTHTLNLQLRARSAGTAHLAGWELGLIKLGN